MFQLLEPSSDRVIGMRVNEKLTQQDYEKLVPIWEEAIAQHDKIRLLWQMDDFEGWNSDAAATDLVFDFQHHQQVERLAIVGEDWWDVWMSKVSELMFPRSETQFFRPDQLPAAWAWVKA